MNDSTDNRKRFKTRIICGIIPLLFLIFIVIFSIYRGPYYNGCNIDPSYAYLLNSLSLIYLTQPGHIDHPGTPLQMIGAGLIIIEYGLKNLFGTTRSIQDDVILHPEQYLVMMNLVLNGIVGLLLYINGLVIFYNSGLWLGVLLFQLIPFYYSTMPNFMTRGSPDCLLVIALLLLSLVLIKSISHPDFAVINSKKIVLFGIIIGFGLASKITMLPFLLFCLIPRGVYKKIYLFFITLAAFFMFTLPILPQYGRFSRWVYSLITHKGVYGQGPVGFPDLSSLWLNFKNIARQEPLFIAIIVLLFCVTSILLYVKRRCRDSEPVNKLLKIFSIYLLIVSLQLVMTMKHYAINYLIPSMSLTGLIFFSITAMRNYICFNKKIYFTTLTLLIVTVLFGIMASYQGLTKTYYYFKYFKIDKSRVIEKVHDYPHCKTIYYYTASSVEYAFAHGNMYSRGNFANKLDELYPGNIFYDIWTSKFFTYKQYDIDFDPVKQQYECFLFHGLAFGGHLNMNNPPFHLEPLIHHSMESLYKFIPNDNGLQK